METTGCSKELTPPGLVAVSHSHDTDPLDTGTGLFPVLSVLDPMLVLPGALDGPLACPTPHSSPPFDRIVALCHFII
jgi:hypothetical protein